MNHPKGRARFRYCGGCRLQRCTFAQTPRACHRVRWRGCRCSQRGSSLLAPAVALSVAQLSNSGWRESRGLSQRFQASRSTLTTKRARDKRDGTSFDPKRRFLSLRTSTPELTSLALRVAQSDPCATCPNHTHIATLPPRQCVWDLPLANSP